MAAIEVPMHVSFDKAALIRLEPGNGPTAQPVLSFALSIQIPMFALVNALAEFQSKYIAEQGGLVPIAQDPKTPEPAPGSHAPSSLAGVAEKTSSPLSAKLPAVASTRNKIPTPEDGTSTQRTTTWEPLPQFGRSARVSLWEDCSMADGPGASSDEMPIPVASAVPALVQCAPQPAQPRAKHVPAQPRAKYDAGERYIPRSHKCQYQ